MVDINEIDARVLRSMGGRQKVLVLLDSAGYPTIKDVAKATGLWAQDISGCLRGEREYPEVRETIARLISVERVELDAILTSTEPAA